MSLQLLPFSICPFNIAHNDLEQVCGLVAETQYMVIQESWQLTLVPTLFSSAPYIGYCTLKKCQYTASRAKPRNTPIGYRGFPLLRISLNSGTSHNLGHGQTIRFRTFGHVQSFGFRKFPAWQEPPNRTGEPHIERTFWSGLFEKTRRNVLGKDLWIGEKFMFRLAFELWTTNDMNCWIFGWGTCNHSDLWFWGTYNHSDLWFWGMFLFRVYS